MSDVQTHACAPTDYLTIRLPMPPSVNASTYNIGNNMNTDEQDDMMWVHHCKKRKKEYTHVLYTKIRVKRFHNARNGSITWGWRIARGEPTWTGNFATRSEALEEAIASMVNKKQKHNELSQIRLKELLAYDETTGIFTWKVDRGRMAKIGGIAGNKIRDGYIRIIVEGKMYGAHRLAFLWKLGRWPEKLVDHIDCVRDNNAWINLRECTHRQNALNRKPRKDKKGSSFKGVWLNKKSGNWCVGCGSNNEGRYLGTFNNEIDAHRAYTIAAIHKFGEYARFD
jgi:hypothetical protein